MTNKQELLEMDKSFRQITKWYQERRKKFMSKKYKAKSSFCIGVSAGHGDINPISMKYTTAPNKMFRHKGENMHGDGYFYEGAFNRQVADRMCALLKQNGMVYQKFYHEHEDWKLSDKTDMINHHHVNIKPVLLFDIHSNASKNHNARGFSVYTSPGQTQSDLLATHLWNEMFKIKDRFGFSMRQEKWMDGDVDYEERFWMLIKTACPSILPEFLFFDNIKDARILILPSFQEACAEALFNTAVWGDNNIKLRA